MFSAIGSLAAGALGFMGSQDTNSTNQDIAAANNATSIDIAKHGVQYKMDDFKAAGLNPALAYNSGPINMPNLSTPVMQNSGAAASQSAANFMQSQLAQSQIEAVKSQTALNTAQADKVRTDTQISALDYAKSLFLKDQSWDTASKQLDADSAIAIYKQLQASNDWNTIGNLNDFAVKQGYSNFQTAVKSQEFLQSLQDLKSSKQGMYLQGLQIPEAEANAAFYKTDFGKSVAPYMSTAKDISSIGTGVAGAASHFIPKTVTHLKGK